MRLMHWEKIVNITIKSKGVGFVDPNVCKTAQVNSHIKQVFFSNLMNVGFNQKRNKGDQVLGLGQLLIEIDNRVRNDGLVLLRATNRPEVLDPALVRPGRFQHSVLFSVPNKKKREFILKLSISRVLGE